MEEPGRFHDARLVRSDLFRRVSSGELEMTGPTKQQYDELLEASSKIAEALLPSDKDAIHQRNVVISKNDLRLVVLSREAIAERKALRDRDMLAEVAKLLPKDNQKACNDVKTARETLSTLDKSGEANDASDALDKVDDQITEHFSHASPALQRKFDSFSQFDWDSAEFDAFLLKAAPILHEARKQAVLRVTNADAQTTKAHDEIDRAAQACKGSVNSYFPNFDKWSGLLYSFSNLGR